MTTPAPQTIDTDALRDRLQEAPDDIWEWRDYIRDVATAILDDYDRLRAAETAGKARGEELERNNTLLSDALHDCSDPMPPLGDSQRDAARAEITRLTDAGAKTGAKTGATIEYFADMSEGKLCEQPVGNGFIGAQKTIALFRCGEPGKYGPMLAKAMNAMYAAPSPPAAADRGVLGQRVSDALARTYAGILDPAPEDDPLSPWERRTRDLALDLLETRAALATAPKAEDVRREALEEAAKVPFHEYERMGDIINKACPRGESHPYGEAYRDACCKILKGIHALESAR